MKFLMGVKDSFSQVRTLVFLTDTLPSLNKVYALLIQEEVQRTVIGGASTGVESTILAAKGQNFTTDSASNHNAKGKDMSMCTHCGKLGHTANKCYKLHGFPLGFKFKNKPSMAHQVSSGQAQESLPLASPFHNHPGFTLGQYQQLLALTSTPQVKEAPMANVAISSNTAMTGIDFSHSVFFAQVVNRRAYGRNTWVLDTGATNHKMLAAICARINQKMSYMLSGFVRRLVVFRTLLNGSTNRFRLLLFVLVIFLPGFCVIMKNFKLRFSSLQLG